MGRKLLCINMAIVVAIMHTERAIQRANVVSSQWLPEELIVQKYQTFRFLGRVLACVE